MESTDTKQLFLSRFLLVFERDGLVALIHQLRPKPIYVLEEEWLKIASGVMNNIQPGREIMAELMTHKLLVDNSDIDRQILEATRRQVLQKLNRPTILYLMMAQSCNFACNYCPIPALAKQYGEHLLSFEDAVAGIALWQKHIKEYPQDDDPYFLIFYGGEPLLNRKVLERLLPYVTEEQRMERLPKKLELMLCTNGSLIDEQLSKMLACYGIAVAVGVDGPQEYNDSIRVTNDGKATFTGIERTIKMLVNDGVRVVASVAITPANVHRLAEYPDFLRKLGIAQFGFNLMKGKAIICELAGGSIEDYCRAAARGVLAGLASVAENGQCYEYQLEKKLAVLRNGLPFSIDCTCYGNQLVIQADGQVSNCPFFRFDQGRVRELPDTFRIGQTEVIKAWRNRLSIFNNSVMANNNGILDGGGCAWSSSELYGDVIAPDTNNAIFIKEVMHELIWTLLPGEQANMLRRGEITHWGYRRVRSLPIARTDGL